MYVVKVDSWLSKPNSASGRFDKCIWNNNNLEKTAKISIRKLSCPLPCFTVPSLVSFFTRQSTIIFFPILNIYWTDFVSNTEVLKAAGATNVEAMSSSDIATLASPHCKVGGATAYQRWCCTENCPLATMSEGHQGRDTKILCNSPSLLVVSTSPVGSTGF